MRRAIKLLALSVLLFGSCAGNHQLAPGEYVRYFESSDHQLRRKVLAGNSEYTIQYATPEYMAMKEFENNQTDDIAWHKRIAEMSGYSFFLIQLGKSESSKTIMEELSDAQKAEQSAMYYDQQAAGDLTLRIGQAELKPVAYHFENNYGLVPYNTIVVGFKTGEIVSDMRIVFNDRYHNNPLIQAEFPEESVAHLPALHLK